LPGQRFRTGQAKSLVLHAVSTVDSIGGIDVLFFGGNGHASVRLERVRSRLLERTPPIQLVDVPYPGFEGRKPADSLQSFLGEIERFCKRQSRARAALATGIGGLIALTMRARACLPFPLILEAPVLWGLTKRWFPRLMRWAPVRRAIAEAFRRRSFQKLFVRRYFRSTPSPELTARFFEGYAICPAFEQFFEWFTPAWLRELEGQFPAHSGSLEDIYVWWGAKDRVVDLGEIRATERALGVRWPVKVFDGWGHYPMIDVPEEWAQALVDAVASAH
jgi:pimeloyl-ACP methyl ester carboxylesterase